MKQTISLITLGVSDLAITKRFYVDGFGWTPSFVNDKVAFYDMNGPMLCTYLLDSLEQDMGRSGLQRPGAFSIAHNVARADGVQPVIDALLAAGGTLIRAADEPVHGGWRGYVADPDDHAWEIAWHPDMPVS